MEKEALRIKTFTWALYTSKSGKEKRGTTGSLDNEVNEFLKSQTNVKFIQVAGDYYGGIVAIFYIPEENL
jgi:hypothetical protein